MVPKIGDIVKFTKEYREKYNVSDKIYQAISVKTDIKGYLVVQIHDISSHQSYVVYITKEGKDCAEGNIIIFEMVEEILN